MSERLIFFTGAPGSRWSTLAKVLSGLPTIDNSDQLESRTYRHHDFGGHSGSYFGPGMEFGRDFDRLEQLDRETILAELARPYSRQEPAGFRLVKSHLFAHHLDFLRQTFPGSGIMLVWRDSRTCLEWWLKLGGFDIPYPNYSWYRDRENMAREIRATNEAIGRFVDRHDLELTSVSPEWIWQTMGVLPADFKEEYFADVLVAADFRLSPESGKTILHGEGNA